MKVWSPLLGECLFGRKEPSWQELSLRKKEPSWQELSHSWSINRNLSLSLSVSHSRTNERTNELERTRKGLNKFFPFSVCLKNFPCNFFCFNTLLRSFLLIFLNSFKLNHCQMLFIFPIHSSSHYEQSFLSC